MTPEDIKLLGSLAAVGAIVAVGKMLASEEKIKPRQIIGRAILSAALGVCAGAAVIVIPGISFVAQVALACVLTSLGVSALEAVFNKYLKK